MPSSDYFLPRASQAPQLDADAIAAYRAAGWHITEHGRVEVGQRVGPCARCREPTVRYGPTGQSLCPACRGHAGGGEPS